MRRIINESRSYLLRNANSDFGSTYLGMALPSKLVYAPVYVKTPDVTGPHRNANDKKPRRHKAIRGFSDFFGLLRTTCWCQERTRAFTVLLSGLQKFVYRFGYLGVSNTARTRFRTSSKNGQYRNWYRKQSAGDFALNNWYVNLALHPGDSTKVCLGREILGRLTLPALSDVAAESQTFPHLESG